MTTPTLVEIPPELQLYIMYEIKPSSKLVGDEQFTQLQLVNKRLNTLCQRWFSDACKEICTRTISMPHLTRFWNTVKSDYAPDGNGNYVKKKPIRLFMRMMNRFHDDAINWTGFNRACPKMVHRLAWECMYFKYTIRDTENMCWHQKIMCFSELMGVVAKTIHIEADSELNIVTGKYTTFHPAFTEEGWRIITEHINFPSLKFLDLTKKKFRFLPDVVCKITNLTTLIIKENTIRNLQPLICNLVNLVELKAEDNQLDHLPEGFDLLTNLRTLHLGKNRFSFFPPVLFKMNHLHVLQIENNHITDFSPTEFTLNNLRALNLNSNCLTTIPDFIFKLPNLLILKIGSNKDMKFDPDFVLSKLSKVELELY